MGRRPCCSKEGLNKGAWTALEDKTLTEYINLHGEGKWRSLPQKAGLKRCGKSCRLRWLNYLRPDIKRGNISLEEEDLIIRLHNLLGNRWSLIAGRLPGRTDNEIKNYWNTNLAKKGNNTSSKKTRIGDDGKKNEKTYESHNVIRTKAMKFKKTLFTPQVHQIGPMEHNFAAKKQEVNENFISKSEALSISRGEDTNPAELVFDATTEDAVWSDVLNFDFSGFLDINNIGNDDRHNELSPSSDGSLIFSKNVIENWTKNSCFSPPSYDDLANWINYDGGLLEGGPKHSHV